MKRRDLILALSGVAAWPLVARAALASEASGQRGDSRVQTNMPIVGFLRSSPSEPFRNLVTAFSHGLEEAGFVKDRNVAIEFRWADNHTDRLPAMAAELIERQAAVLVGDNNAALAAKALTKTVPIVFAGGGNPVESGLVASLNRPGGNVTGVVFLTGELGAKRLGVLRELFPKAEAIGMLVHPSTPTTEAERRDVQATAQAIGQRLIIENVRSERDIERAFATFAQRGANALLVGSGPFLNSLMKQIIALATRHTLPTIYFQREAVVAGGLISYGTSITDAYRQTGVYAGRILKGEKPADLPVMQATKFELVLNLKTAKAIGLDIPPTLLALADEVIE
jgi:putative tryptophan/tyrosine transport system substrate-binding protein